MDFVIIHLLISQVLDWIQLNIILAGIPLIDFRWRITLPGGTVRTGPVAFQSAKHKATT